MGSKKIVMKNFGLFCNRFTVANQFSAGQFYMISEEAHKIGTFTCCFNTT